MPNQKGSLKDRIRAWNIFLRYKLKQKREKRKQKRQYQRNIQILASGKYYSKPKVFYMTVLGLFAGLFEKKINNKNEQSIEKQIVNINQKVESNNLTKADIVLLNNIENKVDNLYVNKVITINDVVKYKEKLNIVKDKIKNKIASGILPETLKSDVDYLLDDDISLSDNNKSDVVVEDNKYVPILEIKVLNNDLKKFNKKLEQLNSKVIGETNYNSLYEYEFSLRQLKIKLNSLINAYNNLRNMPGFQSVKDKFGIKDIDIYDLRNDGEKIKQSIEFCDQTLTNIEIKKQELLNNYENKAGIKSDDLKKHEKMKSDDKSEEKKEKSKDKILEVMLANKIILDNIAKEKKQIEKFRQSISKLNKRQKRRGIFYYSKRLVSSIIGIGFSLFPLSLFKNKVLGLLTSNIMLNNTLRSVRRVLSPDDEIPYIDLEAQLNLANNQLNQIVITCDDSLRQIEYIRHTLCANYGNDIEYIDSLQNYLQDLSIIEQQIINKQEMILNMSNDLEITMKESKQKIKMIDGSNYY